MKNKVKYGVPDRITFDNIDEPFDWILSLIREACFVPYFVENWIMIIDCEDMGVIGFPVKFLMKLLKLTQLNHASCMHRMFFVNIPSTFNVIWGMAKRNDV